MACKTKRKSRYISRSSTGKPSAFATKKTKAAANTVKRTRLHETDLRDGNGNSTETDTGGEPMARGSKGKYADWITPDGLLLVEGWARDGLNDEQIANNIGIGKTTFYRWQEEHKDFREAVKRGKAPVDIEVENALLKRALGYEYEEVTTEVYGDGKKHVKKVKKVVPPDVGAMAFWLKNRRPAKWRDKREEVISISDTDPELIKEVERAFYDATRGD